MIEAEIKKINSRFKAISDEFNASRIIRIKIDIET